MSNTLGEKIKALRKELNMTQSQLAGKEMTKSMLSQIENNISNPSMKTLNYIANKLNKPMSYFLEDTCNEIKTSLETNIEYYKEQLDIITHINILIESNKILEAETETDKLINNFIDNKNLKLYGDVLLKLGNSLSKLKQLEKSEKYTTYALNAYIQGNFYIDASKAYVVLGKIFYNKFDYEKALNICEKAFAIYYKSIIKDSLFEIELYHCKILLLSALGDIYNTIKYTKTAIECSSKTSVYYKTSEFYRLNAIFSCLNENRENYNKNIQKALKFAEITNDRDCLSKIYTVLAMVALDDNEPEKALEFVEKHKFYYEKEIYIYNLIKARVYYILGKYNLAYKFIVKVDFPSYERHKFDYLNMWSAKTYEGLILSKLGKSSEAIASIKLGIEKMVIFRDSKFIVHAYKSLSEVYSSINDFENSFIYLKKANEIQDNINTNGNILF